jgi:5-methylcytosine-specific restriction enzyme subunit McrC
MTLPSRIPVANIYYLYCYAWERFSEGKALVTGAETSPDLPNLLTRVLLNGMRALFRRGLDRAYQPIVEELATVRGHIEISASLRLHARNVRRLQCAYDELSHDVLHNQILKSTLKRLCGLPHLERQLASEVRQMLSRLDDVTDIRLTKNCFARVQLRRNNAYYDLMLRIAQLLFEGLIPAPDGIGHRFKDVLRDEREMARLFEAFVRNFYRAEQAYYRVEPLAIPWDATSVSVGPEDRLPQMRVDVFLRGPDRQVIIDTKYYAETLQTFQGATSFRSGNLYQLFSYLKNHAPRLPEGTQLDGMLLYPQAGTAFDAIYDMQGHKVRVSTVDLSMPWKAIEQRLLAVV